MLLAVYALLTALALTLTGCKSSSGERSRDAASQDGNAANGEQVEDARAGIDAAKPGDASVDPGWMVLGGTTSACRLEVAKNPTGLLDVAWEPCPELSGCRRFAFGEEAILQEYFDAKMGIAAVRFRKSRWMALIDMEARLRTVWRAVGASNEVYCNQGDLSAHDGYVAFAVRSQNRDSAQEPVKISIFYGPIESIEQKTTPTLEIVRPDLTATNDIVDLPFTSSALVARFLSRRMFWISETGLEPVAELKAGHLVSRPQVFGSQLWWEDIGQERVTIVQASQEGPSSTIAVADAEVLGFDRDGNQLAWFELRGDVTTLWTATVNGTEISDKRQVAVVPLYAPGTLGDGLFAHPADKGATIVVYDLKLNKRAQIKLPVQYRVLGELLDITATSIYAGVDRADLPFEPIAPSLWQIDTASLVWEAL